MTMSYEDHLKAAEKDITSRNFCNFVDIAVILYEEERRQGNFKEEEESDKSFFHTFPRKTRTYMKGFVSRRKNLNWSSSSSSSLFLGGYKIAAGSKKKNPKRPRFSSSLCLGDYSEKTVMKNPRNPTFVSCVTRNKSQKRRAVQESTESKKAKVATFSWKGKENPEWLIKLMRDMEGADLSLIFEKTLFKTDVNPKESRLSMPINELIKKEFLTPLESRIIEEDINSAKKMGVGTILVDQTSVKWGVMLKRWEMKKKGSGKRTWNYALTCGWNDVVKANGLKHGDDISIWSFRWCGILCFALVTPPSMALISS